MVSSADAGLRAIDESPPDIVVTDVIMPKIHGLELVKILRSRYPRIRVIAISGGGSFGAQAYKPDAISTHAYLAAAREAGRAGDPDQALRHERAARRRAPAAAELERRTAQVGPSAGSPPQNAGVGSGRYESLGRLGYRLLAQLPTPEGRFQGVPAGQGAPLSVCKSSVSPQ